MPDNISDDLADRFTAHDVDLTRLGEEERQRVVRMMKKLERDLVERINAVAPGDAVRETARFKRTQTLLKQTQRIIRNSYKNATVELESELRDVADMEAGATRTIVNNTVGADVMTVGLPPSAIRGIVNTSLTQGDTIGSWMRGQSAALQRRFDNEIRMGMLAGESNADLVRRIRGTRVVGAAPGTFTGGVMNASTTEATTLVRTATATIANNTRMEVFKANRDVIKGVQALVTLDSRTSDLCKSRSGMAWDVDGDPLPGTNTNIQFPGPPPWHFNCRTTLIPVLKSWEELGAEGDFPALPPRSQASMNGQVAGDLNYEQWLARQSVATQRKALGVTKQQLWRDGAITSFRDLVDQTGRPLTIGEIQDGASVLSNVIIPDNAPKVSGMFYKTRGFSSKNSAREFLRTRNIEPGRDIGIAYPGLNKKPGYNNAADAHNATANSKSTINWVIDGEASDLGSNKVGFPVGTKFRVLDVSDTSDGFRVDLQQVGPDTKPVKKKITKKRTPRKKRTPPPPTPQPTTVEDRHRAYVRRGEEFASGTVNLKKLRRESRQVRKLNKEIQDLERKQVTTGRPSAEIFDRMGRIAEIEDNAESSARRLYRKLRRTRISAAEAGRLSRSFDYRSLPVRDREPVRKAVAEALRMTNGRGNALLRNVTRTSSRAYAERFTGTINIGRDVRPNVIWHELGHFVEFENADFGSAAVNFIRSRARTPRPKQLRQITGIPYGRDELAYEDEFFTPYVGKEYGDGITSEVVSMGIENLVTEDAFVRLVTADLEHALFVIGGLR